MYKARLFYNTGFNVINIPRNVNLLYSSASRVEEFPAMDIITAYDLDIIRIKISNPDDMLTMGDADYCELYNDDISVYYTITKIGPPTSADVVTLQLVMDPLLTYGILDKLANITSGQSPSITGIIERTTDLRNIKGYDTRYDIIDELLKPVYSARHEIYSFFGPGESNPTDHLNGFHYLITTEEGLKSFWDGTEKTFNVYGSSYLETISKSLLAAATAPVTITGTAGDNYNVTFSPNFNTARYSIGKPRDKKTSVSMGFHEYEYPGLTFYGDEFLDTAQTYYNFGIANPVAVSYQIPAGFIKHKHLAPTGITPSDFKDGVYSKITGTQGVATVAKNAYEFLTEEMPQLGSYPLIIRRIIALAGMRLKLSAVGTGQEATIGIADLEEIITPGIEIYLQADPTPYGAPYYSFRTRYNLATWKTGESVISGVLAQTLYGAVRGATWQAAPVSMSNLGSQNELNGLAVRQAYAAGQSKVSYDSAQEQLRIQSNSADARATASLVGALPQAIGQVQSHESFGGAAIGIGNMGLDMALQGTLAQNSLESSAYSAVYSNLSRQLAIAGELDAFNAAHIASNTQMMFPVSQSLPLFMGNGAMLDVEYPELHDLQRYLKILQWFGCKAEIPEFNFKDPPGPTASSVPYQFIKTRGVSLKGLGALSKTAAAAAEEVFNAGVRIWYHKPTSGANTSIYKEA